MKKQKLNIDPAVYKEALRLATKCTKDARLADLAPEMLAVLEQVEGFFSALEKYTEDYPGGIHTHKIVKAIISKAEGK